MFLPFINGRNAYPTALADDKGRRAVILRSENARQVEDHFRHVSMEMGSAAGLALAPVNTGDLMGSTVLRWVLHPLASFLSSFFFFPCSGELQTQKLRSHLLRTPNSKLFRLKPGVSQYTAMFSKPTARNFFLANIYLPGPVTFIFSQTSIK